MRQMRFYQPLRLPPSQARNREMRCASDSVTREGTQSSFPTRERCISLGML